MKPKKEIFDFALNKANALPEHSIMIGDCLDADIKGAMNAGIDQVFMNHINKECSIKPTYVVHSIKRAGRYILECSYFSNSTLYNLV